MRKQNGKPSFWLMSAVFALRDLIRPPIGILRKAGVGPGQNVLDYGCGPGGFSLGAARLVGPTGNVYAVDINSLALIHVRRKAERKGFKNISLFTPEEMKGVSGRSLDVVLLYDVLHALEDPAVVLAKLHGLIKPGGVLSVSDHHLEKKTLHSLMASGGMFRSLKDDGDVFAFSPVNLE